MDKRFDRWQNTTYVATVEIRGSARKHGVPDEDMRHAVHHHPWRVPQDDGIWMHIGPNRSGHLILEVAVASDEQGDRIIHAMPARAKFLR